jgi:predicted alpha/beta-fold hydrolase
MFTAVMKPFTPQRFLRNPHAMTVAAVFWPRNHKRLPPPVPRLFEVEPGTRILAKCNWQPDPTRAPALVIVHGLEGDSESNYLLGIADRAFAVGFNVLRMNQRNCGGTEKLTPTLYNSGLSNDYRAVLNELIERDGLTEIFLAGYSMGGNLALKMAGELGEHPPPQLLGIVAVGPALDLARCVDACALPRNRIYERHFVRSLRRRMRRKNLLYPGVFKLDGLDSVRTLREFDDKITAPNCGYLSAADYYDRASAIRVVDRITVPTLIITSKDDTLVPYQSSLEPAVAGNPHIRVIIPDHGGHCSFISNDPAERHWAEARVVEFCSELHAQTKSIPPVSQATG